ncbi:uncharacterized protein STAUR_0039 [Stigmatella aurantiaca DW4/3-1]|uniref:Uncharacterized protein n=1 Tax=Stigmatella aurantiaca (strain DW4/3-1) TaxID=378806 RepID=E3FIU8_STIAD|nr:uncharacterized protein STAUR_0039 [Stigmatella aurantiaca DW4/3-1]
MSPRFALPTGEGTNLSDKQTGSARLRLARRPCECLRARSTRSAGAPIIPPVQPCPLPGASPFPCNPRTERPKSFETHGKSTDARRC